MYVSIMIGLKDVKLQFGEYFFNEIEGSKLSITALLLTYVMFIIFHVPFMFFTAKEAFFLINAELSYQQISGHVNQRSSFSSSMGDGSLLLMRNKFVQFSQYTHYKIVGIAYTSMQRKKTYKSITILLFTITALAALFVLGLFPNHSHILVDIFGTTLDPFINFVLPAVFYLAALKDQNLLSGSDKFRRILAYVSAFVGMAMFITGFSLF